jgi:hypothetical protein
LCHSSPGRSLGGGEKLCVLALKKVDEQIWFGG